MKPKTLEPMPMELPVNHIVSAYDAHEVLTAIHTAEVTLCEEEPNKGIITGALMSARMLISDVLRGTTL